MFVVVLPSKQCRIPSLVVVEDNSHQLPIGTLGYQLKPQPGSSILSEGDTQAKVCKSSVDGTDTNSDAKDTMAHGPPTKRQCFDDYRPPYFAVINIEKSIAAMRPEEAS